MNIKQTTAALALALAATAAGPAFAQEIMGDVVGAIHADDVFVRDAVALGYAEVSQGQLAQGRATAPNVKQFGSLVTFANTSGVAKITAIANTLNLKYPSSATPPEMLENTTLEQTTRGFDRAFLNAQVSNHTAMIAIYKKEGATGTSPQLKTYAQNALPALQSSSRSRSGS